MKTLKHTPCSDWVQKLAARHPDDLSTSEHIALDEHLALCQACSKVHTAYQTMESGIRSLLLKKPVPILSYDRSQLESKTTFKSAPILPVLINFVVSAFSSLLITISWSRLYQQLHTWFNSTPSLLSQKIAIVSSNSHYTYAMRSDSGFILWQQKRYQKHNLGLSVPVRLSSIGNIGGGVAYASALDFCRYTAQA